MKDHAIRVDVTQGTATLTGYVSQSRGKSIAADIASSVGGVRQVSDMLIVNPDRSVANEEQCIAIAASISRIIGMANEDIVVSVVDNMARFSGNVDATWKREAAENAVRKFAVLKVCNDIVVTSD